MMVGITSWQQQVPVPQSYTGSNSWSIPLQPEFSASPLSTSSHLLKGAMAVGVNGIPIFNPLNNRGEDAKALRMRWTAFLFMAAPQRRWTCIRVSLMRMVLTSTIPLMPSPTLWLA